MVLTALRSLMGALFIVAATLKIAAPLQVPGLTFAVVLAEVGVPWPSLVAWMVIGTELICGAALCWRRVSQVVALPLIVNLGAALYLVGLPGLVRGPLLIHGIAVGGEWWRVPLELLLLFGLGIVVWTGPYTLTRVLRSPPLGRTGK